MKNILTKILVMAISTTVLISCSKTPNHSIRIENSYAAAMSDVKINSTSYGQIASGSKTGYKPVNEGTFSVSGSTVNGQALTGSGSVSGNGTHKWTMTITSTGTVTLKNDK